MPNMMIQNGIIMSLTQIKSQFTTELEMLKIINLFNQILNQLVKHLMKKCLLMKHLTCKIQSEICTKV